MTVSNQGGHYGGVWANFRSGVFLRGMTNPASHYEPVVASMCSFNYEYAYIITLIVNELIEDNSVKESIVH